MTRPTQAYGSTAYYKEMFADILGDLATGRDVEDEETMCNILEGFELAIFEWLKYYEDSARRFKTLHARYLRGEFAVERADKQEASF